MTWNQVRKKGKESTRQKKIEENSNSFFLISCTLRHSLVKPPLCHQSWQGPKILHLSVLPWTCQCGASSPLQVSLAKWGNCSAHCSSGFCWFQGLMVAILYCFINNEVRETLFVPICLISIHHRKRKLKMVLNCYIVLVQDFFFYKSFSAQLHGITHQTNMFGGNSGSII